MKVLDFLKAPLPDAARVFVVSGSESFLREQAVRKIKDALGEDVDVSLLHGASTRDKEGVSIADLFEAVVAIEGDLLFTVESIDPTGFMPHLERLLPAITAGY